MCHAVKLKMSPLLTICRSLKVVSSAPIDYTYYGCFALLSNNKY